MGLYVIYPVTYCIQITENYYIYIYIYNFEVTMGSYDGAEVSALSGIFMLSLIGNKYNPNNKQYRTMQR